MRQDPMGRQTVSRQEAAALLGCSVRTITAYTRRGLLHAIIVTKQGNKQYYVDEVLTLKQTLADTRDPGSIVVLVTQLAAKVDYLSRRLELVESTLGFDIPILSYERSDVLSEYWLADSFIERPVYQVDAIKDYTKRLLAMNEEFLSLVEQYTEDREPWRVFVQAAEVLKREGINAPPSYDEELAMVQRQLQVAQKLLEQKAIAYVARRSGERAAYALFPETEPSVHHSILSRLPKPTTVKH